ncbi:MAG: aminotransferase class V-fold PLP-dependent enzyme [Gemmatimonadetes bacterium]|nr:aminotransferase class V-fold PLP-dependent enzyme [Gemmatimonadota bacterium]
MSQLSRRRFLQTTAAAGLVAVPGAGAIACSPSTAGESADAGTGQVDDPLGIRGEFPVTEEFAYLNTASVGPLPVPVRDALAEYADQKMRRRASGSLGEAVNRARTKFASLFGADENEIAFLYATSGAENIIVNAIDWQPGDNVVIDELHFVTTFVLYRELERRAGVEPRIVRATGGAVTAEDFAARTDHRTRLLSVAWVSNRNGFRHDLPKLAELAHSRGAFLYADAIQAWGQFPVNLHDEGVDFACGNGYKWLHADFGCAPFYVRREHLDWMAADRFGHRQVAESLPDHRFRLKTDAEKLEYANPAYGPTTALAAALDFIESVGTQRIAGHTHSLAADLRGRAEALGMDLFTPPDNPSAIVSFYHGLDPEVLGAALNAEGVQFSFQEDGRLLRAAIAMFNNRADVDRLLGVVRALV